MNQESGVSFKMVEDVGCIARVSGFRGWFRVYRLQDSGLQVHRKVCDVGLCACDVRMQGI